MSHAAAFAWRVRRVTVAEWWLLCESAALAVGVEIALRCVPLARILRALEGRPVANRSPRDQAADERLARLARWPYRVLPLPSTCLRVSLVQVAVLRRRQVPATLRLGVRRVGDVLHFHAWVDCDGPLDDHAGAASYRAFEPVPAAAVSRSARWSQSAPRRGARVPAGRRHARPATARDRPPCACRRCD